ncbi:CRISPR-associated endoribonuclease Cas6 [Desulfonauticus submarinus]|uniref:CRISPR-associated endoribonuclease Cas6 n=1 Tax=Desulfonauticus submarinus TaxID=206665 RepID=A0A1H0FUL3_9BACT|nr:CRISPR system precrRNA processing endoribonuclease RAMP protein Cas6 [Desulfonauticus submarinus]SDN98346.1 CRISPR-associated endoribonuclease Cas6 [Desulfonauticus submarinus]
MEFIRKINFLPLNVKIQAQEEFLLPVYKGGTFRGGFGYTFKRAVCALKSVSDCKGCILSSSCVYAYIFETLRPEDTKIMRRYEHVPHPFVLCPPLERKRLYQKGDILEFGLVLIGKAIEFLPYFIIVFQALASEGLGADKGKCVLKEITSCDGKQVYRADKDVVKKTGIISGKELIAHPVSCRRVRMDFLTPLRLQRNGKIIDNNLSFQDIFRALLRRVSLLTYFHCNMDIEDKGVNFKLLIEKSKEIKTIEDNTRWFHWKRYSTRQKRAMPVGGLIGDITFEGNFEPFWLFLRLGEYFHVGKNTSFGLGKYKLNY